MQRNSATEYKNSKFVDRDGEVRGGSANKKPKASNLAQMDWANSVRTPKAQNLSSVSAPDPKRKNLNISDWGPASAKNNNNSRKNTKNNEKVFVEKEDPIKRQQELNKQLLEKLKLLDQEDDDDDVELTNSDNGIERPAYKMENCLICMEKCPSCKYPLHLAEYFLILYQIRHEHAVWQCTHCYCHQFHLYCIQKWIQDGVKKQGLSEELFPAAKLKEEWNCPNCRGAHLVREAPKNYYCYCGKTVNPEPNPWNPPHTCGELCGKHLKPDCGHSCVQPCHSGKCQPCPTQARYSCYCGSVTQVRRCSEKNYTCNKVCHMLLACGQHHCERVCHPGDCPPCSMTSAKYCQCKKVREVRSCNEDVFQCQNVCGKAYGCGHHKCEQVCHSGECGPCPRTLARTCFCGKKKVVLACTKEVSSCGDTCDKKLSCGQHRCMMRCHAGPCEETCRDLVKKTCHCGKTKGEVICSEEFYCQKRCQNTRECGKHPCNTRCCDEQLQQADLVQRKNIGLWLQKSWFNSRGVNCPPCKKICGKTLNCKNHTCEALCHTGKCQDCPKTIVLTCFCGGESKEVSCQVGYDLDHSISKCCRGEHKTKQMPCKSEPYLPCKDKCGVLLKCGKHTCQKKCHIIETRRQVVEDTKTHLKLVKEEKVVFKPIIFKTKKQKKSIWAPALTNEQPEPCDECKAPCDNPRTCSHICPLGCHLNACLPCQIILTFQCHSHRNPLKVPCHAAIADGFSTVCKEVCMKPLLSCSHRCSQVCHYGSCARYSCPKLVKVTCKCGTKKDKWECAKAQIERKNRKLAMKVDSLLECDESCPKEPVTPVQDEKPKKEISVKTEETNKKKKEKKPKVNEKEEKEEAQKKQKQVVTKMAKLQKKPFPYEYLLYAVIAAIVMAFGVYVYLEPVKQIQKIK